MANKPMIDYGQYAIGSKEHREAVENLLDHKDRETAKRLKLLREKKELESKSSTFGGTLRIFTNLIKWPKRLVLSLKKYAMAFLFIAVVSGAALIIIRIIVMAIQKFMS